MHCESDSQLTRLENRPSLTSMLLTNFGRANTETPMRRRVRSSRSRIPRGRRFVAVDIENVIGGPVRCIAQVARAKETLTQVLGLAGNEHIVVGVSHNGLLSTGLGWSDSRVVVRSGPSGADMALLQVIVDENIASRFDEVVLVSGDGIFTDVICWLGRQGVPVTLVARPDSCARSLRLAASRAHFVSTTNHEIGGVA